MPFTPGQAVIWLYVTPTGWNWTIRVRATVVRSTAKRVCIDALMKDGTTRRKWVKPESLEVKEEETV